MELVEGGAGSKKRRERWEEGGEGEREVGRRGRGERGGKKEGKGRETWRECERQKGMEGKKTDIGRLPTHTVHRSSWVTYAILVYRCVLLIRGWYIGACGLH